MTVKTQTWPLGGGLDLVSPALSIPPGAAILAQNFEPALSGGYKRMDGYTIYDGSSTSPAAVPGSGDLRGLWVYNNTLYAFRDNAGGTACVMHKATASGWTTVTTPALTAGGSYEFVNENFTGSSSTMKMYGCDGVNKAFEFDGTTFTQLTTGMTTDTPSHIASHSSHLFLSFEGSIQHSATGDPTDWTVANGAGEIGVGDDITLMRGMQGGVLAVVTDNTVQALHGTSVADWVLKIVSAESGGKAFTSAYLENDLYFLNDAGLSTLQAVQAFGDFATSNLSRKVKPYIDVRSDNIVGAVSIPEKNQYRLFYDDKTVLVGAFLNREIVGFTTFLLEHTPSCVVSSESVTYFGTSDGEVMLMDSGTSFNGGDIQSFLRLPFTNLNSPHRKKRFRKMVMDVDAGSQASINYSMDFEYGEKGSSEQAEIIYGSGGYWDAVEWGAFTWSSPTISRIEGYIDGTGRNFSLLIRHKSATDPAFTLQGVQVNYSLRGLQR